MAELNIEMHLTGVERNEGIFLKVLMGVVRGNVTRFLKLYKKTEN
jgi:hypothetical protein